MRPRNPILHTALAVSLLHTAGLPAYPQDQAPKKIVVQGQGNIVIQGAGVQGGIVIQAAPAAVPAQPAQPAAAQRRIAQPQGVRILGATPAAQPSASPEPILRWKDGSTLPGNLADLSPTHITWRNPAFADPIHVSWDHVQLMGRSDTSATSDSFRFATKDGSHFYGTPIRFKDAVLEIESSRLGRIHVRKESIDLIQQIRETSRPSDPSAPNNLVLQGPQGDAQWSASDATNQRGRFQSDDGEAQRQGPDFQQGPGGTLESRIWNRTVQNPVALPEECEISFIIRSYGRPDFLMAFGTRTNKGISIETWDDEVVAHGGVQGVFKRLATLQPTTRSVAVSFRWNSRTGEALFRTEGMAEPLAFKGLDLPTGNQPGITLSSKGLNLVLEDIRVATAGAGPVPPLPSIKPNTLVLNDGRSLPIKEIVTSANGLRVSSDAPSGVADFAWNEVRSLRFSNEFSPLDEREPCIQFSDGTLLHASPVRREGDALVFQSPWSQEPFKCDPKGVRLLRGPMPKTMNPSTAPDSLTLNGLRLRGTGVFSGGPAPKWLFPGASQPVAPQDSMSMHLIRNFNPDPQSPSPVVHGDASLSASSRMLVFTRNGEVLPAAVSEMDADFATLEAPLFKKDKVPRECLSAVYFNPFSGLGVNGFKEGWKLARGRENSVTHKEGSVRIEAGAGWFHPQAMRCNDITFNMQLKRSGPDFGNVSAVAITPYSDGQQGGLPQLLVAAFGNARNVNVGIMGPGEENPSRSHSVNLGDATEIPIRLRVLNREIEIYVGGERMPLNLSLSNKRSGNGLLIEPGRYFGNNSRAIELGGFSAKADARQPNLPALESESRKQVLSIPRAQRDEPPRHLLVSVNGDVLRGYISESNKSHITLKLASGSHQIPMDRLQAAIWMTRPAAMEAEETHAKATGPRGKTLAKLEQPIQIFQVGGPLMSHIFQIRAQDNALEIDVDGTLAAKQVNKVIRGDAGDFTIGAYLRRICEKFEADFDVDEQGRVRIRARGAVAQSSVRPKVYLLKNDPFITNQSAPKAFLESRGLVFPPDGALDWEPGTRQLKATLSAEGHAKLLELLRSATGDSPGMPTHWVTLRNGAFFALTLTDCSNDLVRGNHALLGPCEFAVKDLQELVNFPANPPAFVQSFMDWRQEHAPEPDIPKAAQEANSVKDMFNFGK